jgi:hypothetical protein
MLRALVPLAALLPGVSATRLAGSSPAPSRAQPTSRAAEVLRPVGGVPAHVAGQFRDPFAFQQAPDGQYLVFDRRAHTVWRISEDFQTAKAIVTIGQEQGKLYVPSAFAVGPSGVFAVADAPDRRERIQVFDAHGVRLSGFTLPGRAAARVTIDTAVLNGVSSLEFTGRSVVVNRPEDGALASEYSPSGTPLRSFGALRATGHEADRDLHLALNVGLPLSTPDGGAFFVFVTGEPRFRKYDARGQLRFERLMQGREIDALIGQLPNRWPRRTIAGDELPLVPPTIRTAAVDPDGNLWVALASTAAEIYVFDAEGEKLRVVRLEATGPLRPNSLSFVSRARLLVSPGLYEFTVR